MKNAVRAGFLALIAFEAISWSGILPVRPDYSWVGLALTAILVLVILEVFKIPSSLSLIALGNVIIDAVSDMFNLYSRVPNWDKLLHLLGGATAAVIFLHMLFRAIQKGSIYFKNPLPTILLATIFAVSFLGIVYETQEYLIDVYKNQERQLGDGRDTVKDQLFNIFGAALASELYILTVISKESRTTTVTRRAQAAEAR